MRRFPTPLFRGTGKDGSTKRVYLRGSRLSRDMQVILHAKPVYRAYAEHVQMCKTLQGQVIGGARAEVLQGKMAPENWTAHRSLSLFPFVTLLLHKDILSQCQKGKFQSSVYAKLLITG